MDMQCPSTLMLVRSALAICSKSIRTPLMLIACVDAVPSAAVGIFFRKST